MWKGGASSLRWLYIGNKMLSYFFFYFNTTSGRNLIPGGTYSCHYDNSPQFPRDLGPPQSPLGLVSIGHFSVHQTTIFALSECEIVNPLPVITFVSIIADPSVFCSHASCKSCTTGLIQCWPIPFGQVSAPAVIIIAPIPGSDTANCMFNCLLLGPALRSDNLDYN